MKIDRTDLQKIIIDELWGYVENAKISGFKEMHGDDKELQSWIGEIQTVMEVEFSWFIISDGEAINDILDLVLKENMSHEVWEESALELEYQNGKWFIYFNS